MPLLCISLLALLLLPLSLSCDKKKNQTEVRNDYMAIVKTHLDNTRGTIAALLETLPCPELRHKPHNCTPGVDFVSTLYNLTCKMKNLRLRHTQQLATSVQNSIQCTCPEKPTKEPGLRLKKRRTATRRRRTVTRRRRNEEKQAKRETRKLCRAMAILSAMTECYEMLNAALT